MVNNRKVALLTGIVWGYVGVAAATVVALAIMSATGSPLATSEAWGHAVIVAVFAVLLPLRWRAARRGGSSGLRAVGIISAVLLVVNVVEAVIPGLFPMWMRIEMIGIAVLMAGTVLLVIGLVRRTGLSSLPDRRKSRSSAGSIR